MNLTTIKLNLLTVIIIVTVLLAGGGIAFYAIGNKMSSLKNDVSDKVRTTNALNDSIKRYKNIYNEDVAEKLTLQGTIKDITDKNNKLNSDQKELIKRINNVNEQNILIAAANITLIAKIDSLTSILGIYNSISKSLTFSSIDNNLNYKITIDNIALVKDLKPKLEITNLTLPNKQFVEFHWSTDKNIDHPVSFSISNSNKYFITTNVNSYIIPEVNKDKLKPTTWQKIGQFFTKTGGKITVFGTGVGVGALTVFFLTK